MLDRRAMLATTAATLATPALATPARGSAALNTLFDQFVKEMLDNSPLSASSFGLDVGARAAQKSRLDDFSRAGLARDRQMVAGQHARLSAFDRASLNAQDQVGYDVVLYGLKSMADACTRFGYGPANAPPFTMSGPLGAGSPYVISQLTGSYCNIPSFLDSQHAVETKDDAEAYLARLSGFAVAMDQEIEVARHDMAKGVIPPDFLLAKTLPQMQALRGDPPDKSGLTTSLTRRAAGKHIPGAWSAQAAQLVRDKVYPALDRQIALVKDMQKHAVHDAGVWRLPDGEAYYRASLRSWATTDKSPEEVHKLGLEVVAENTARIETILKAQGMTKGTVGERLKAMSRDPKFLVPNTDAAKDRIIADLGAKAKIVRARLPAWFGTLPKAEVTIRRVPKAIESGRAPAYYEAPSLDGKRAGIFWINLRNTAELPNWTLPTYVYHEAIPGHHLQLSIQREAGLPLIRKMADYSAYSEGWGLYAEELAVEMGMYDSDPLGHIGQLHGAMWRGVRLVLDSGMHALKWSRERAIRYYVDSMGDKESGAITEVERYCAWPGQASTYMLGKLALLAQRDRAKAALGAKFDIRKFHDAVLLPGAVPTALLEGIVGRYIAAAKA